jgi:hypothetical protein
MVDPSTCRALVDNECLPALVVGGYRREESWKELGATAELARHVTNRPHGLIESSPVPKIKRQPPKIRKIFCFTQLTYSASQNWQLFPIPTNV